MVFTAIFLNFLGDIDYYLAPENSYLAIGQGLEVDCTNISIRDDLFVEPVEEFNVTLSVVNYTFTRGVFLTPDTTTVQIIDNDGMWANIM